MFQAEFTSNDRHEGGLVRYGAWLASRLAQGKQLLLDCDGVVVRGDSLNKTRFLERDLLPQLAILESKGVATGLATERGEHVVRWLRDKGLKLRGASILEGGQLVKNSERLEYLVSDEHLRFVDQFRKAQRRTLGYRQSWQDVISGEEMIFCPGNFQWQGRARVSFWFRQTGDVSHDGEKVANLFLPNLHQAAAEAGLNPDEDIYWSVVRMKVGNLGIFVVKSNGFDKATAASKLRSGAVLVEDGFGAINLGQKIKDGGGAVIGIKGNLDISSEPAKFLREVADVVLDTPMELVTVLSATNNFLIKD